MDCQTDVDCRCEDNRCLTQLVVTWKHVIAPFHTVRFLYKRTDGWTDGRTDKALQQKMKCVVTDNKNDRSTDRLLYRWTEDTSDKPSDIFRRTTEK